MNWFVDIPRDTINISTINKIQEYADTIRIRQYSLEWPISTPEIFNRYSYTGTHLFSENIFSRKLEIYSENKGKRTIRYRLKIFGVDIHFYIEDINLTFYEKNNPNSKTFS